MGMVVLCTKKKIKMRFTLLAFDLEHTGYQRKGGACVPIQCAWQCRIFDSDKKSSYHPIIRNRQFVICGAKQINRSAPLHPRFTVKYVNQVGCSLAYVLRILIQDMKASENLIMLGASLLQDFQNMLRGMGESKLKQELVYLLVNTPMFCIQKELPSRYVGRVGLKHLYSFFTGDKGAQKEGHDAFEDVHLTMKIYLEGIEQGFYETPPTIYQKKETRYKVLLESLL